METDSDGQMRTETNRGVFAFFFFVLVVGLALDLGLLGLCLGLLMWREGRNEKPQTHD